MFYNFQENESQLQTVLPTFIISECVNELLVQLFKLQRSLRKVKVTFDFGYANLVEIQSTTFDTRITSLAIE